MSFLTGSIVAGNNLRCLVKRSSTLLAGKFCPIRSSLRQYRSLRTFAALSLYLLARLRLCLEEFSQKIIKFLFFYFHRTCMIAYWRGRKDSDLRNVLSHVSPDYKSGALDHSATAPIASTHSHCIRHLGL